MSIYTSAPSARVLEAIPRGSGESRRSSTCALLRPRSYIICNG